MGYAPSTDFGTDGSKKYDQFTVISQGELIAMNEYATRLAGVPGTHVV